MQCHYCSKIIPTSVAYCAYCGTETALSSALTLLRPGVSLPAVAATTARTTAAAPAKARSGRHVPVWGKILAVAFFLFIAFVAIVFGISKTDINPSAKLVLVDNTLTIEEMVRVGGYDWVPGDADYETSPIANKGPEEVELHFITFAEPNNPNEVIEELDKMGFRPARLRELLALGAQYPNEQRKYPVVAALGSVFYWKGFETFPILESCTYGPRCFVPVTSSWFQGGNRQNYHYFLAVRK